MSLPIEVLRPLPKEQLEKNVIKAEGILGRHLIPHFQGMDIYSASLEDIQKRYPFRYQLYLDALRAARTNQVGALSDLDTRLQRLSILNNIDRSTSQYRETNGVLYERQKNVYQDISEFLESGRTDGYIKLPTGTGKTVLFSKVVEAAGVKTLIVVPRGFLINQTVERFDQFTDLKVGQVSKAVKDWTQNVTIMTYDYLIKAVKEGLISPDDYGMLILDEAHRALGKKTQEAVKAFKNSIRLGFTATPNYSEFKKLSNLLPTEIHNMTIREAVEEGLLSSFSVILAETEVNLSEVSVTSEGDYNPAELERAVNIESRNEAAVNLYKQEFSDKTGVFYCVGVNHAERVAVKLNEQGIIAAVISGRQSRKVQSNLLERYQNGEIQVLCNADILIEGFDAPRASVCMNLRPTFSSVVAEQRGGRVLRVNPLDSSKHAYIVDFIDQNTNRKTQPISFAQIAEAASIIGTGRVTQGAIKVGSEENDVKTYIEVAGLKVHTSTDEIMRIIGKIVEQKYVLAPVGWLNNFAVTTLTGRTMVTVRKYAEEFKTEHPEWFRHYLNPGGVVVEYFDPRLVDILVNRLTSAKAAPEGWQNSKNIADATGRTLQTVKLAADKYLKEHPEWQGRYLDSGKQVRSYFSPELSALVMKELTQYERAPEGWYHTTGLVKEFKASDEIIRRIARKFEKEHPGWIGYYLDSSNNPILYYSPELVSEIKKESEKRQPPPEGWVNFHTIAKSAGKDLSTIKRVAFQRPDQMRQFTNPQGRSGVHYVSPEVAAEIVKEVTQYKRAPEGWQSVSDLATKIGRSFVTVQKFMSGLVSEHPKWGATYLDSSNNPHTYYSPEAVATIEAKMKKYDPAPSGWRNVSQLRDTLWRNGNVTRKKLERYKEAHPEWFGEYLDSGNRVIQYYSPELIQLVQNEVQKSHSNG